MGDLIGELILNVVSVGVGTALAWVTYAIWLTARWHLWGLDRTVVADTPSGERYILTVANLRLHTPVSTRLFRSGNPGEDEPPGRSRDDWLHPDRMLDRFEEGILLFVPFILAVVLVFAVLFVIELIVAAIILAVVVTWSRVVRRHWTCTVVGPEPSRWRFTGPGMRRIRRMRDDLAAAIRSGDIGALERVDVSN
ncbi:MAG: hypothetical protein AAF962_17450 [Actinomycetota bacterium]